VVPVEGLDPNFFVARATVGRGFDSMESDESSAGEIHGDPGVQGLGSQREVR
jgi:hypothetical protein